MWQKMPDTRRLIMNLKKTLVGLMVASSLGAIALPAQALDITLNFAPPAPRYENVPPPRYGYVWESGYWQWNGRRHVWVAGHWERARPGYAYVGPRWVESNGRWQYQERRWDRDGDGYAGRRGNDDGYAGRRDRDRNGITVIQPPIQPGPGVIQPGGRVGDRDGDGAPDDVDTSPDDKNRG